MGYIGNLQVTTGISVNVLSNAPAIGLQWCWMPLVQLYYNISFLLDNFRIKNKYFK